MTDPEIFCLCCPSAQNGGDETILFQVTGDSERKKVPEFQSISVEEAGVSFTYLFFLNKAPEPSIPTAHSRE